MDDLISRKALLAEYDRVHIGIPGRARKLIENAPKVDAAELPIWATERAYKNGYEQGKKDALKWIPVSERLPTPYVDVIVCREDFISKTNTIGLEYVTIQHGEIPAWSKDYMTWKTKVKYWMPLPEPPKGE